MIITLDDQIKCVAREIVMRERIYPKWVAAGKMLEEMATREVETMRAVLASLLQMQNAPKGNEKGRDN